ncbi:MAG TPA: SMI1/KNR4 family protein [Kofleriaceae bacterium]
MSELLETLREAIAALDAADPGRRRFGAARHRYRLAPALDAAAIAEAERRLGAALPDDLRAYVAELSAGGAGPYYGLVPVDRAGAIDGPPGAGYRRGLPLAHLGCGYLAVVACDGDARGEVWIDARALGVSAPIAPSTTAFVLDWVDRVARGRWLEPHVPPGACPLAVALSGYLAHVEAERGVAPGQLAGADLREALGQLGPGAIEIAASSAAPWFADGEPVDPCVACLQLVENLGLLPALVAPGALPAPLR